ncbi:Fe(3+)-citrate-binding protein YfmC [Pullulanibacillus camelliae]|uniref:Fe(3+)-citrate-binding protein YfmC n=1 Tax=Pullulanibacillus camelliae TaxID=1707096 RepID=A0A8J2YNW0_9BACL|nr:ABC transporter substrate-binding protein [Pullulanibacillus camelliae]GGE56502.1 Fe(3+)-citrate-binding protein YfmC [Pullulanibacillus camelliae]
MKRQTKHLLFLMLVLALSTSILFGCNAASSSGHSASSSDTASSSGQNTRTITHLMGKTKIKGTPKRVVTLEFGLTDAVVSLGVSPVGVADDGKPDNIAQEVRDKMKDYKSVGSRAEPNLEVIRTLHPDLIIGDSSRDTNIYKQLSDIAPTIILPSNDGTYQDAIKDQLVIGKALNKEKKAQAFVAKHKEKVAALKKKVPKNTSILIAQVTDKDINARASTYFQPGLMQAIGFKYALKGSSTETIKKLTMEQLLQINPDILVITKPKLIPVWEKNPLWKDLKAVKNHRVYGVSHTTWSFRRSLSGANQVLDETEQNILK